jgi:hypothetical protein
MPGVSTLRQLNSQPRVAASWRAASKQFKPRS